MVQTRNSVMDVHKLGNRGVKSGTQKREVPSPALSALFVLLPLGSSLFKADHTSHCYCPKTVFILSFLN